MILVNIYDEDSFLAVYKGNSEVNRFVLPRLFKDSEEEEAVQYAWTYYDAGKEHMATEEGIMSFESFRTELLYETGAVVVRMWNQSIVSFEFNILSDEGIVEGGRNVLLP